MSHGRTLSYIDSRGSLTVIFGPMKASKSEKLKSYLSMHSAMKHSCMLISNSIDNRGETGELECKGVLTSHNPHSSTLPPSVFQTKASRLSEITASELEKYNVIAIDEAQFFKDILLVLDWVRHLHKTVYVAGLVATSEGTIFGEFHKLLPFADYIKHLKACCVACQAEISNHHIFTPAIMSKCLTKKDGDTLVGASGYIPLCHHHWLNWESDGWYYKDEKAFRNTESH